MENEKIDELEYEMSLPELQEHIDEKMELLEKEPDRKARKKLKDYLKFAMDHYNQGVGRKVYSPGALHSLVLLHISPVFQFILLLLAATALFSIAKMLFPEPPKNNDNGL